jgi:hypothetical protein
VDTSKFPIGDYFQVYEADQRLANVAVLSPMTSPNHASFVGRLINYRDVYTAKRLSAFAFDFRTAR